jgi:hypothetical protein
VNKPSIKGSIAPIDLWWLPPPLLLPVMDKLREHTFHSHTTTRTTTQLSSLCSDKIDHPHTPGFDKHHEITIVCEKERKRETKQGNSEWKREG